MIYDSGLATSIAHSPASSGYILL